MKKAIFLLILVFLLPLASAKTETITFEKGDSYVIENVNITIIDINRKDERTVLCVNDFKTIIGDEEKRVNGIMIEPMNYII